MNDKKQLEVELLKCARDGDADALREIIDESVNVDFVPETELGCQGLSALHLAVRYNHPKCVKMLLQYGANIDIVDNFGFRPIHDACLYGHLKVLRVLLNNGAHTEGVDRAGLGSITPFLYAAQQDNIECLKLLLNKTNDRDIVLWDLSSKRGNLELLDLVSNTDIQDSMLCTWLQNAAVTGNAGFFVRFKQSFGRNLNENEARTVLLTAAQHGKVECIRALTESGVAVNLSDDNNFTALHFAARYGHNACIQELDTAGADLEAVSVDNWTPLHVAVRQCQGAAVCKLIELGCNINAKGGSYHETPLQLAAATGDEQLVKILLESNSDLLAVNKMGKNVLGMSISKNIRNIIIKYARN